MTTSTDKSYFDLHITGLGYLNRIREVKPKKGDAFLACDIAALNGPSDEVSYVRFDTRVSGTEAQHLVRRCIQAVDAETMTALGPVYESSGTPMGGGTVGLQVGDELFIGSFTGDRILRVALPRS